MKKKWTVKDIELLRQYYLEQKSIKVMAQLLGHSPTAINKCLSRFKIRPLRTKKFISAIATRVRTEQLPTLPTFEEVSAMVLQYGRSVLGFDIEAVGPDKYIVNREPMTLRQILLRVNMHRVQHKMQPFRLD